MLQVHINDLFSCKLNLYPQRMLKKIEFNVQWKTLQKTASICLSKMYTGEVKVAKLILTQYNFAIYALILNICSYGQLGNYIFKALDKVLSLQNVTSLVDPSSSLYLFYFYLLFYLSNWYVAHISKATLFLQQRK